MNNQLAQMIRKQLSKKFPLLFPARISKHQASKRGYQHSHNYSRGELKHQAWKKIERR